MTNRLRRIYLLGLLATALIAALVAWSVFQWTLPPEPTELEALPVLEEVTSPGGTWTAVNYVTDMGDTATSDIVVSPRDGSSEPRLVYHGLIAEVRWRGDSTLVVRDIQLGTKEVFDAATASYTRFNRVPWDYLIVIVIVLVPTAIVLALGIALTIAVARSRWGRA